MVIGNGMVAARFASYTSNDDVVIFASGVSNSKNTDPVAYERETKLLKKTLEQYPDKLLVYFSTCSLYDPEEKTSPYYNHKLKTEEYIQQTAASYNIFRVSNIVGRSANQNTILNFFYYHLINRVNFDLWSNTTRNLIDIDDMFAITDSILQQGLFQNQVTNIANPVSNNVKEIIETLGNVLGIKGNYIPIPKGRHFEIDITVILPVIAQLSIPFGRPYLLNLVKKYYPHS